MKDQYKNEAYLRKVVEEDKKTQKVIAEECGCSIATISYYCRKFGIKSLGRKYKQKMENLSNHISSDIKEWNALLIGTILGGASLRPISNSSAVYEIASQSEMYIKTIQIQLGSYGIDSNNIRESSERFQLTTLSYAELYDLWGVWYRDKKKIIPGEIHNKFMNPESFDFLAHFFMKGMRFYYEKKIPVISFTMGRYKMKQVDRFFGDIFSLINIKNDFMIKFDNVRRQKLVLKDKAVHKFMEVLCGSTEFKKYENLVRNSLNTNYKNLRKYLKDHRELKFFN